MEFDAERGPVVTQFHMRVIDGIAPLGHDRFQ